MSVQCLSAVCLMGCRLRTSQILIPISQIPFRNPFASYIQSLFVFIQTIISLCLRAKSGLKQWARNVYVGTVGYALSQRTVASVVRLPLIN